MIFPDRRVRLFVLAVCLGLGLVIGSTAHTLSQTPQTQPTAEGIEFFEKNIRPVLAERCYSCHSDRAANLRGDLRLDSRQGMLKAGKSGVPAIIPGKPQESLLIAALQHTSADLKMPPGSPLPAEQVEAFVEWVRMGAPDPRESATVEVVADKPPYNWEDARRHWSYQPVTKPIFW